MISRNRKLGSIILLQGINAKHIFSFQGTTGFPKATVLSHHGILNNARFVGFRHHLDQQVILNHFLHIETSFKLISKISCKTMGGVGHHSPWKLRD